MSKLPSDIRLHIARKATKEAWKIDDLLTTIILEIEAREISESTKSSGNNQQGCKGNNAKNSNPSTAAALVANDGKLPDNSKIQCVYCSGHHYSASCEKIDPFEARKKVLSESSTTFEFDTVSVDKVLHSFHALSSSKAIGVDKIPVIKY